MQLINHFVWKVMAFKMARCVAAIYYGFDTTYQPVIEFSRHEMNIVIVVCMILLSVNFRKQLATYIHHVRDIPSFHIVSVRQKIIVCCTWWNPDQCR